MATASEMAKGPHLRLVWLREKVDEVRGVLAELYLGYCWLWYSGKPARARWSNGDDGGPLRLRRESEGGGEMNWGAGRLTSACWGFNCRALARRGRHGQAADNAQRHAAFES